jgi:large subunit ribosomal protein L6
MVNEAVKAVTIQIPDKVDLKLEGRKISVKGPKGELTRDFSRLPINFSLSDKTLTIEVNWPKKKLISLIGTIGALINNMIKGVQKGYTYKLKVVYAHFPITVKVQRDSVIIQNFSGERYSRIAKIVEGTKVTTKGDEIIVEGIDLEKVSQTAANIELATILKDKDPRVFLDGIFISEKGEG